MDLIFRLPKEAFEWVDYIVVWIGFSTIIGFIATSAILGRKGLPPIATIVLGYAGTIIGWSLASVYTTADDRFVVDGNIPAAVNIAGAAKEAILWKLRLLSPATFAIALAGTIGLLLIYKLIVKQAKSEERS